MGVETVTEQEITDVKGQLKELDKQEDQFNQIVQVIPESDDTTLELTVAIGKLKEQLDKESGKVAKERLELNKVKKDRALTFIDFF